MSNLVFIYTSKFFCCWHKKGPEEITFGHHGRLSSSEISEGRTCTILLRWATLLSCLLQVVRSFNSWSEVQICAKLSGGATSPTGKFWASEVLTFVRSSDCPIWIQISPGAQSKLLQPRRKLHVDHDLGTFPTGIIPPSSVYIHHRIMADSSERTTHSQQKTNLLCSSPNFCFSNSLLFSISLNESKFVGVLGGLVDPKTASLCPSATCRSGRCLRAFCAKNRLQICVTILLVGLAAFERSSCVAIVWTALRRRFKHLGNIFSDTSCWLLLKDDQFLNITSITSNGPSQLPLTKLVAFCPKR